MKKIILILVIISSTLLSSNICQNKIFNIRSKEGAKIIDFIEQITELCHLNLIIDHSLKDSTLDKKLSRVYIKEKRLREVLNLFLSANNIYYTLSDDILKLSYISTKTYHIDYIASDRKGETSTEVSVGSGDGGDSGGDNSGSGGTSNVGTKIESQTLFENFWEDLKNEIYAILNRPEDKYLAGEPIINAKAGMITVSGTLQQLIRVERYLKNLEEKLKRQVLIDVNILSVTLNQSNSTGINWSNFYHSISNDGTIAIPDIPSSVITTVSIDQILQFLRMQGEVTSISNPKIVALNNQPALISVGNEYFYSIKETQITDTSSGSSNTLNSTKIESVFAGILLNITAEISNDGKITLNVSPSVSQTSKTITPDSTRSIPPDLTKKQLSSVITTENGKKVILGGLITRSRTVEQSSVPLLGHLPILGAFFRSEKSSLSNEELIIIITPYVLDNKQTNNFNNQYKLIENF